MIKKMLDEKEEVKRALVTISIEKALLGIGKPTYDEVLSVLNTQYHCYLPDCYEHPEYLNEILRKLYGNAGRVITKSITTQLEEFNQHKPIKRFLEVICD